MLVDMLDTSIVAAQTAGFLFPYSRRGCPGEKTGFGIAVEWDSLHKQRTACSANDKDVLQFGV